MTTALALIGLPASKEYRHIAAKIDRNTLTEKRDYALILLALTGGLRTVEISRADVSDLRKNGERMRAAGFDSERLTAHSL